MDNFFGIWLLISLVLTLYFWFKPVKEPCRVPKSKAIEIIETFLFGFGLGLIPAAIIFQLIAGG